MNTHSHSRPNLHGRVRRLLFSYALYATLPLAAITAAPWQVDDEVKLTRDTPLLFGEKPFRTGKAGETFRVLAYKADRKKVFLAAKDGNGKAIALNVAEDLVVLPAPDVAKVQADVQSAVKNQQFSVANQIVERALRANPGDLNLQSLRLNLQTLSKSVAELAQARARQQSLQDEIKRLRRNADVTDHPNPLNADDQSGQQRASAIRSQATQLEDQAKTTIQGLQANYDAAIAALGTASSASNAQDSADEVRPGLPETPEQKKRHEERQRQDAETDTRRRQKEMERLREWTDDPAVVPARVANADPSYQETIDFINNRLGGRVIWFGQRHQTMIVKKAFEVCTFDLSKFNPEVKAFLVTTRGSSPSHVVQIESSDYRAIEYPMRTESMGKFDNKIQFYCADELDAQKVAKAFSHLITMCGGTKDPF